MNEQEVDLLDELYFVQSYAEVIDALGWEDADFQRHLLSLVEKEYIKVLSHPDQEFDWTTIDAKEIPLKELYYVASKKGLLEHNGF